MLPFVVSQVWLSLLLSGAVARKIKFLGCQERAEIVVVPGGWCSLEFPVQVGWSLAVGVGVSAKVGGTARSVAQGFVVCFGKGINASVIKSSLLSPWSCLCQSTLA